jgi:hypothetical protein
LEKTLEQIKKEALKELEAASDRESIKAIRSGIWVEKVW